jgi:hypothetical protein
MVSALKDELGDTGITFDGSRRSSGWSQDATGTRNHSGAVGSGKSGHPGEFQGRFYLTDPGTGGEFVRETGIDAPSASVGNIHELTRGRQRSIPIGPP